MIGWLAALALWLCTAVSAPAWAQEDVGDSRATSFQAVQGAQREDVPGGSLLIGAYGVVLVLLVAYVARLGIMGRKNANEVERLTRALEQKRKS